MPTLDFKGKQIIYANHLTVPARTLEVVAKKSLSPRGKKPFLDDNLIIHGDNLHALKALMPRYAGKVNCIYIDPPYNTGNEKWMYNDNVNSPMMKEWLKGKSPVDGEDLERHDKWLCMMWPRLQLLRELLAEDGVIFISIDDNEQHRLRMMMDEIFGEENFITCVAAQLNPRGRTLDRHFAKTHEYILVYAKDYVICNTNELPKKEKALAEYKHKDSEGKYRFLELRNRNPVFHRGNRPNLFYPIWADPKNHDVSIKKSKHHTEEIYPRNSKGKDGCWTWGKEKVRLQIKDLQAKLVNTGKWRVYRKDYIPSSGATSKSKSLWLEKEINNETGKEVVGKIFSDSPFDFPKSHELIKKCVQIGTDRKSIILDSFAGSGTTAHAVLALNKEDGGNRKFILVECENKIADKITAERVRRVIKGVPKAKDEVLKNGLGGGFTYCTLGDEMSIEKMLTGKNLPDYETLARHVAYTATGQSPDKLRKARGKDGFFYETKDRLFYLIYEPTLAFLRSADSALNSTRAQRIAKQAKAKKKTAVVFATHKFMGQKELSGMNIVFCGLPYGISSV